MYKILLDDAPRWKVAYLEVEHGGALFNDRLQRPRGFVPVLESTSVETTFPFHGSTHIYDILTVVEMPMVRRDRSKIFDVLVHTKADEEVLYATILRATDKASVENLKAEDTYVNYGQDVTFPQRKLKGGSPLNSPQFCVRWMHVKNQSI
ncbi:hypothetical protein ARMGADRAFT_1032006 [Armillaria gallica]|uniref:Uncharacterized protein n=1 Tax=Armillaria gallica TaxID=47427 RepID=A0A2H3DJ73_ARMGA|nr:hypothetical protein ARMGADRAFT_1032006 [Armillaria gallica]